MEKQYFIFTFTVVILLVLVIELDARRSFSTSNAPAIYLDDYERELQGDIAFLYGYTKAEDYHSKDGNWLDKNRRKRGLGPIGLKLIRGALISAGVIHAASLAISTAKLGFDIWFNQNQCCGVHKSICSDYKEYTRIKNIVLGISAKVDEKWLELKNAQTYLFALSKKNDLLHGAMVTLDSKMVKLVKSLDPEIENKIRNATYEMKRMVALKNETISNITIAEQITVNIFGDVISNVMRAVSFLSDGFMVGWVVKKLRKYNSEYLSTPKTRPRSNAITGMDGKWKAKAKGFWHKTSKLRQGLVHGATTILTVYASVQDVLYIVRTLKACNKIAKETKVALDTMRPEEKNVAELLDDVTKMKNNLSSEFDVLKASYYTPAFQSFLVEVVKLAHNAANQTSEYVQAAKEINYFDNMIYAANPSDTVKLVQLLIDAFGKINHKLDCLTKKMNTINYATQQCKKGSTSFDDIFMNAQQQQVNDAKECVENGYITKDQIRGYISDNMKQFNKQSDCLLNNEDKKSLVCSRWVKDEDNAYIAKHEGLTVVQVKWFITVSKCSSARVTPTLAMAICSLKDEDKTKKEISKSYSKYDQNEIFATYDKCEIKQTKKDLICDDKKYEFTIDDIYASYNLYPKDKLKAVFDACPKPQLSVGEKKLICRKKNDPRRPKKWGNAYYNYFIGQYGETEVKAAYDSCAVKTKKDNKPYSATFKSNSWLEQHDYFEDYDDESDISDI